MESNFIFMVKIVNTDDRYSRMVGYTSDGAVMILSDNTLVSLLVEYDNNGNVINLDIDSDEQVKEVK